MIRNLELLKWARRGMAAQLAELDREIEASGVSEVEGPDKPKKRLGRPPGSGSKKKRPRAPWSAERRAEFEKKRKAAAKKKE